jgi:hypothetical protein
MRDGISIEVSAADREQLAAVVAERNSPQRQVWRAWSILAAAEGCGTLENHAPRRGFRSPVCGAGKSGSRAKASRACCVTRLSRTPSLPPLPPAHWSTAWLTLTEPPGEGMH